MKKHPTPSPLTDPKRIVSWWVRMPDLNWPSPDGMDAIKRRAEEIAKANATTAMIFGAHFRWDFLPYFTLLHDYLGTVAEELHKCGVELYDHHSVNLVHRYDTRDEMRHVMLHSGPHLPFSPSREAAASWEYNGKRLNDWRMTDVKSRNVLYFPQYAAEGFCIRNPDFVDAYKHYLQRLIADTGIDGVSADDPVHFMHLNSCACPHCRAELKRRTGLELPPVEDRTFWGNWANPAWRAWLDLRHTAARDFFATVTQGLPEGFRVTTCGHDSASPGGNEKAADARSFLTGGCNYINLEMSGNMPPYKADPVTTNVPIPSRVINANHHQACAREHGVRCFSTGFGFTKATANVVWAVNKLMGADCWFSCLKDRLGLPGHILDTLPDEAAVVTDAFTYEAEHPQLFGGRQVGQVGVYFSYETRNHTYFGNLQKGYYRDYSATLQSLFEHGISPHTVFDFPENPGEYPLILLPSAAAMTEKEKAALQRYLVAGGRVIATGPCAALPGEDPYTLPSAPVLQAPSELFSTIQDGVKHRYAQWVLSDEIPPTAVPDEWKTPLNGLHYHPYRATHPSVRKGVLSYCSTYCRPLPVRLLQNEGYLASVFEDETGVTVHLLAADFDTDIDHRLDEMRFHRSRVNLIVKAEPVGVTDTLVLQADAAPTVYVPFREEAVRVISEGGRHEVRLPPKTAYAILRFTQTP